LSARRFLHIANGTSTTSTFEQAGIPGASSIWADVLHDGPVPGGLSDDELIVVRARHLAIGYREGGNDEIVAGLKQWRSVIDRDDAYDELVLWYEHDLFDQLNLIQVLTRIGESVAARRPVTLICIGSFPGRPRFRGLGELTPEELGPLFKTREPVTDRQYVLASHAWQAFRAPTPEPLQDLLRTDTSPLPFLGPALARHLEEYPWTTDGLSRTERRVLELASHAPIDIHATFPRMHDRETVWYVDDGSYWHLLEGLSSSSPALVELKTREHGEGSLPPGTIALTDFGRAVLSRAADRVRRVGFDRWLGGVHLSGSGPMWRWDPAQSEMVMA
jgi:hypothetical protein